MQLRADLENVAGQASVVPPATATRALWLRSQRAWNIGARTVHIAFTGILVGGHVFNVPAPRLYVWLALVIISGACLVVLEAWPQFTWLHEARGLFVLTKLGLLCLIPFAWNARVPILLAVVAIASIGSHMPGRFRHYSVRERRVLK